MHAPSTLEENQWPNLEAVEREIADVRRRQLLLQDKLRRQRSLWGAVGNRVRAVVGGTNHHKQLFLELNRLSYEESRLRRAKLQFVLESKVSNLPILHSKVQTGRGRRGEKDESAAHSVSHSWSVLLPRPSSEVRHSGNAKARGRLSGEGVNDAREDDDRSAASAPQPSAYWRTWYSSRAPPKVAPAAAAGDAIVPCGDGKGWLHGMLGWGGVRRKTCEMVALSSSATKAQRDSLESVGSGRGSGRGNGRPYEAAASEKPPTAPVSTAGAANDGRGANADRAARKVASKGVPEEAMTARRRRQAATPTTTTVAAPRVPQQVPVFNSGKHTDNALVIMHDFLNNSFVLPEETRNDSACRRKSLVLAAAAAESRGVAPTMETTTTMIPPPSAWVRAYLDESNKYGLGFALADGSVGVRLRGGTSIVLDPAGVAFEYIEHARRSSSQGGAGGGGRTKGEPVRTTYTLDDFPPDLQKRVKLLHFVRGRLQKVGQNDGAAAATGARGKASAARGKAGREPLVFVRTFRRTKRTLLFQLSNGTVQVMFGDHTEILLSEGGRLITYVRKDGQRETLTYRRVLDEQRVDVRKRLRHSTYLIARVLGRT